MPHKQVLLSTNHNNENTEDIQRKHLFSYLWFFNLSGALYFGRRSLCPYCSLPAGGDHDLCLTVFVNNLRVHLIKLAL